jgi:hypothetical protein
MADFIDDRKNLTWELDAAKEKMLQFCFVIGIKACIY